MANKNAKGLMAAPPKAKGNAKKPAAKQPAGRPYLNKVESEVINKRVNQDRRLGKQAGKNLGGALESVNQPVNFDQLPQAPDAPNWAGAPEQVVGQDFNKWRQDQIDQTYNTYLQDNEKDFAREREDFEQMAAGRGWVPGSDLYNREKSRLESRQSADKNSAKTQAMAVAGQNAKDFFEVGSRARGQYMGEQGDQYNFGRQYRGDAYGDMMQQRYQGLQDYDQLAGRQSGLYGQNNQYSQGAQQADRNNAAQMAQINAAKPPAYGGFGSPENQAAFEDSRTRANQQWVWDNQPKQKQPNPWASNAGEGVGAILGGWAEGGFQNPFKNWSWGSS